MMRIGLSSQSIRVKEISANLANFENNAHEPQFASVQTQTQLYQLVLTLLAKIKLGLKNQQPN
jgi:flagellar basal body rod protein FlgC